jgi:hypothetical protein
MKYEENQLIVSFGIIIILILTMILFWKNEIFLTIFYLQMGVFLHLTMDICDKILYWGSIVMFTIGEILLVYFKVLIYTKGMLIGVPLWIPFNWGLLVLSIERISLVLNEIYDKGELYKKY